MYRIESDQEKAESPRSQQAKVAEVFEAQLMAV